MFLTNSDNVVTLKGCFLINSDDILTLKVCFLINSEDVLYSESAIWGSEFIVMLYRANYL